MLDFEPLVEAEYHRFEGELEPIERLPVPCMSTDHILKAHFLIANHFLLIGEGIGGVGPKSKALLESAVYRQVASFGGRVKWTSLFDITATLFFGVIKNHAFHNANKRTAFLTALFQLYRGGFCPSVPEKQIEDFTVDVADNNLGRFARFRELVKAGDPDPEVKVISKFLRDNTRRIDGKRYVVTFRELQKILNRYGFFLENPEDNRIDVVTYHKRITGFF